MKPRVSNIQYIIVVCFLSSFFVMSLLSILVKSITVDELTHIPSGYSYLKTHDYRMNLEHPPLMKMMAGVPLLFLDPTLPTHHPSWAYGKQWEFGWNFLYVYNKNSDQLVFWARIPMILIGVLLGLYVFYFARDLYGLPAAFLSIALYSFSPNILAHTRLVTTDIGFACFSFITIYYFYLYLQRRTTKLLLLSGIFFGLAMAAKFSAVYIIPTLPILAITHVYLGSSSVTSSLQSDNSRALRQLLFNMMLIFLIGLGILALTYELKHFGSYFKGISLALEHNRHGHPAFFMGHHSNSGWLLYFPVAFAIKTPVIMLALIAMTVIWYRAINFITKDALKRDLVLLIPVSVVLGMAVTSHLNIGLRHILSIYPFLFVFVSQAMNIRWSNAKKYILICCLLIWYAMSSMLIAPHYLAYFNEIVGGPNKGHHYLADSNIDWGQDLKLLSAYLKEQEIKNIKIAYFGSGSCAYRKIECQDLPCGPQPGILAVSVTRLAGIDETDRKCLAWLREFKPVKKIGYSIFIYNIKDSDIGQISK
jgi:hypothetical protein